MNFLILLFLFSFSVMAGPKIDHIIDNVHASPSTPVVIFDLDDTLFYSSSRTLHIFKELVLEEEFKTKYPIEVKAIGNIKFVDIEYDIRETLINAGVKNEQLILQALEFWKLRFFKGEYVQYDSVLEGAVEYVNKLYNAGAFIVYLTGRDHSMRMDTLEHLYFMGFPVDKKDGESMVQLITKPHFDMSDIEYKKRAFESISYLGVVVAFFENEPKNLNAMSDYFSKATGVFLDVKHSKSPDRPYKNAIFINNYNE